MEERLKGRAKFFCVIKIVNSFSYSLFYHIVQIFKGGCQSSNDVLKLVQRITNMGSFDKDAGPDMEQLQLARQIH